VPQSECLSSITEAVKYWFLQNHHMNSCCDVIKSSLITVSSSDGHDLPHVWSPGRMLSPLVMVIT
jgi:hypothetical protein